MSQTNVYESAKRARSLSPVPVAYAAVRTPSPVPAAYAAFRTPSPVPMQLPRTAGLVPPVERFVVDRLSRLPLPPLDEMIVEDIPYEDECDEEGIPYEEDEEAEEPVVPSVHAAVSDELRADLELYNQIRPRTKKGRDTDEAFQALGQKLMESLAIEMIKAHDEPDKPDGIEMAIGWVLDKYPVEIQASTLTAYMQDILAGMAEPEGGAVHVFLVGYLVEHVKDDLDATRDAELEMNREDGVSDDDDEEDDPDAEQVLQNIRNAHAEQQGYNDRARSLMEGGSSQPEDLCRRPRKQAKPAKKAPQ